MDQERWKPQHVEVKQVDNERRVLANEFVDAEHVLDLLVPSWGQVFLHHLCLVDLLACQRHNRIRI